MESLTKKEALEQGYTKCFRIPHEGWSSLFDVADLCDDDFNSYEWELAEKNESHFLISEHMLQEAVEDDLLAQEEEFGCDTEISKDNLKDFDWKPFTEKINESLMQRGFYKGADISLTR